MDIPVFSLPIGWKTLLSLSNCLGVCLKSGDRVCVYIFLDSPFANTTLCLNTVSQHKIIKSILKLGTSFSEFFFFLSILGPLFPSSFLWNLLRFLLDCVTQSSVTMAVFSIYAVQYVVVRNSLWLGYLRSS